MNDDLNQIYTAIGAEIENTGLDKVLEKISDSDRSKIFGACSRLHLVNSLQKIKKNLDMRSNLDMWAMVNTDALQVYLLCTCLDALADKNLGVGERFTKLVRELPNILAEEVVTSYAVIDESSESLLDWDEIDTAEKLDRVRKYLYQLRRNSFTHDAKIVFSAMYTTGISGWGQFIPDGVWDYSMYFCYRRKFHSETTLLRLVIVGKIREILGLAVDQQFVESYWENLERSIFG